MAKTKNITRKNRKQRGGGYFDTYGPDGKPKTSEQITNETEETIRKEKQKEEEENLQIEEEAGGDVGKYYKLIAEKAEEKRQREASEAAKKAEGGILNTFKGLFSWGNEEKPVYGGNKKQPNPAFGGYLKGGKKHVRNTKKNTKKRTGGNKCNCGCRNCRCSRKDCNCKCADKRFNCTCTSRTCGCKRTLKRRKH